jgi:hypothetical protein
MHPYTNKEFDSKLFIKRIKHTPPFGMPGGYTESAQLPTVSPTPPLPLLPVTPPGDLQLR